MIWILEIEKLVSTFITGVTKMDFESLDSQIGDFKKRVFNKENEAQEQHSQM